tara:strand:- start:2519 stop:2704 length:186 start_codon:yes stop_codon:yes gene_type:complete
MSEEINFRNEGICSIFAGKCATPDDDCVDCPQYKEVANSYVNKQEEGFGDDWGDEQFGRGV